MDAALCKLTLVFPRSVEETIIAALQEPSLGLRGFTTWHAEGHGMGFANSSFQERLRGRVDRAVLLTVMRRASVELLLQNVRLAIPIAHLAYWIEPVEQMGVLQ